MYHIKCFSARLCVLLFVTGLSITILRAQDLGEVGKEKPIKVFGSMGIGGWAYHHSGSIAEQRRVPYSWYINGSPTLQIYNFTFPFSFTVSEQQRNFSQPFNQYGVSPYFKNFTLHAGYRNMMFSQYTLAGQTFLGAGTDFSIKKLRIGAMYGRFRKETVLNESTSDYSLPNLPNYYKRMGMGAKIGFGSKANFIDFIFFKGWDDEKSLSIPDSSTNNTPGDNLLTGIKMNFNLVKRISIDVDGAGSIVTLDKRRDANEKASLGLDKLPNSLLAINYSTRIYLAGSASITYALKKFKLKAQYKYIEPDYQSFGSNYIQSDIQDITLSPSFAIAKGKINFSGSIGQRTDNLQNQKIATSKRNIYSANLQANLSKKMGFGLNYSNFGFTQTDGRVLLNDSFRVSTVNQSYGFNLRFQGVSEQKNQMLLLTGNYSDNNDRNEFTARFTQSKIYVGTINYSLNRVKQADGISAALNSNVVKTSIATVFAIGPSAGVNKSSKDQLLKASVNLGYQLRFTNSVSDGGILNANSNLDYNFKKKHTTGFAFNYILNTSSSSSIYVFNEQRLTLRYMYSF